MRVDDAKLVSKVEMEKKKREINIEELFVGLLMECTFIVEQSLLHL